MTIKTLNINDHARTQFAPHGSIQVKLDGAVIQYQITGPFNIETIKAFGRTMAALLNAWVPPETFVTLSFWQESMMTSLEAFEAYRQFLEIGRYYFPQEAMNIWCVPEDLEGRRIMLPKWQALYEAAGYPLTVVSSPEQAQELVLQHLNPATPV